jgi:hypothetical protein
MRGLDKVRAEFSLTARQSRSGTSRRRQGRDSRPRQQKSVKARETHIVNGLTPDFSHGLQDLCTVLGNFGHPLCFSDDHLQFEDRLVIATGLAQLQRVMIARVARV